MGCIENFVFPFNYCWRIYGDIASSVTLAVFKICRSGTKTNLINPDKLRSNSSQNYFLKSIIRSLSFIYSLHSGKLCPSGSISHGAEQLAFEATCRCIHVSIHWKQKYVIIFHISNSKTYIWFAVISIRYTWLVCCW